MNLRLYRVLLSGALLLVGGAGCRYRPCNLSELVAQDTVIRVACLGDSLTLGGGSNGYPARLARSLGPGWEVRNLGAGPGATVLSFGDTPYLKSAPYREALRWEPHVVLILLGTNDSKPRHWYYRDDFERDYHRLLRELKALPSRPNLWVVLPPPAFPGQWGIRDSVIRDEMIPLLRKIAREEDVLTVDLYALFAGRSDLFPDQIHPDDRGMDLMAEAFYQCLGRAGGR